MGGKKKNKGHAAQGQKTNTGNIPTVQHAEASNASQTPEPQNREAASSHAVASPPSQTQSLAGTIEQTASLSSQLEGMKITDDNSKIATKGESKITEDDPPKLDFTERVKGQYRKESSNWVDTNHFRVTFVPGAKLFEYQIVGVPEDLPKRRQKEIIESVVKNANIFLGKDSYFAADNTGAIVAWTLLHNADLKQEQEIHNIYEIEVDKEIRRFSLRYKRPLDSQSLEQYVQADDNVKHWNYSATCDALNILISQCFHTDTIKLGANRFFVRKTIQDLNHSPWNADSVYTLCTMKGYFYSVRPKMGNILLNINSTTSVFYKEQLVSDYLWYDGSIAQEADRIRFLKNLRVSITYNTKGSNKAREGRVFAVGDHTANNFQFGANFIKHNGQPFNGSTNVEEYLRDHGTKGYQIRLQYPDMKLINLGNEHKPSWFPPEVLRILPYQRFTQPVPDYLMPNVLKRAEVTPQQNKANIMSDGIGNLVRNQQQKTKLQHCPVIQVEEHMLKVPCFRIPNPRIQYRNGQRDPQDTRDGRWDLRNAHFLENGGTNDFRYVLLYPDRRCGESLRNHDTVQRYDAEFSQQIGKSGIGTPHGTRNTFKSLDHDGFKMALQSTITQQPRPHVIVLLLRKKNVSAYSDFKYLADKVYGLQSLCVTEEKSFKKGQWSYEKVLPAYMGNVMMKANLKRGGVNHSTQIVQSIAKETLILGADVTHPSVGAVPGAPSIAALVGSIDGTGGRFVGVTELQLKGVEMIEALQPMVLSILKRWKTPPKAILYYRDGVSESQYTELKVRELAQIQSAWATYTQALKEGSRPVLQLIAVVVTKRHHTRFYPPKGSIPTTNFNRDPNCLPGTLVERQVTSPYFQDFFLQSHYGLKGTSKPAHYLVLQNDPKWSLQKIQDVTHGLCFSHVRATLSVSYASPAYYADRLCERGRAYLREFYAPEKNTRDKYNHIRYEHEKRLRALQPALQTENATLPKKQWNDMSATEKATERQRQVDIRDAEKRVRDGAEKEVVKSVNADVSKVWNAPPHIGCEGGRDQLLDTMYWM